MTIINLLAPRKPALDHNHLESFTFSAGSVQGREHRRLGRNNQDAVVVIRRPDRIVAVVADGCSSARASEVGSILGARQLATQLTAVDLATATATAVAEDCCHGLQQFLAALVDNLGGPRPARREHLRDLLLFGFLAAVVGRERYLVFGVGDGLISIDGRVRRLDAGLDNAPPYLAYRLVASLEAPLPRVHGSGSTAKLGTLLIATDGAGTLLGPEGAGALGALERDRSLAANPSLLTKRLRVLGERPGLLHDDTTIALLQRRGR